MLYPIGKFAKLIGVTTVTLRNWHKSGELIPVKVTEGGSRYYSEEQFLRWSNKQDKGDCRNKLVIGYCRVSSKKQKDDLDRQVENMKMFLMAKGEAFKIITDIGSGINYNKSGLNEIIDLIVKKQISKIVVLYKDRLLRFGFELIENICHKFGVEIVIIDSTEKTEEQELVEDMIQIVTVFSAKLQGKRANKAKKMIKEMMTDD